MNQEKLQHIILQGENEFIEFKGSFNKKVIETIVAFSNTKGGKIIIGCNDTKKIIGVTINEESIQNWINEVKQNTEPAVFPDFETVLINNKTVIVITVDEFPLKPISYKSRYYSRKKNSNHLLSIDEITELRFISLNYSFDSFEIKTTYNQLDESALTFFKNRIIESGRFKPSKNLKTDFEKLGFIKNNKLTKASELLFGTHHTSIHLGKFKSASTIIDDLVIRSPLIFAVEEAMDFIKRNIALGFEFTGELKRTERWQYPLQAIRELLLNAIVHRDYSNPTDVIIKIFDERIEISNPGNFISGITIDDILTDNYQSRHRNKLLAEAFYLTGDIEKYGTGFVRLRNWLKEYPNLDLIITDLNGFIRSELILKTINATVNATVNARQKSIINTLKKDKQITINQLSKQFKVSRDTIIRDLKKLKEINIIERIGSDKTGYWQVIKFE